MLIYNDLAATETASVGDTLDDIETAREGGVMSIVTLTGVDSPEKLCGANPDVTVRDLGELQRLLELAPPNDEIRIEALELMARVGVPDRSVRSRNESPSRSRCSRRNFRQSRRRSRADNRLCGGV